MVRKQAVLLAEKRMDNKDILQKIIDASADSDPYVQFQAALTLSNVAKSNPQIFPALSKIISTHINDKWFQDAVLLGASENTVQWYDTYKDFKVKIDSENVGKKEFLSKISSIVGAKYKETEMSSLVKMISETKDTGVAISSLQGMVNGMNRNTNEIKLTAEGQHGLISLISDQPPKVREAAIDVASRLRLIPSNELTNIISKSKEIAQDESKPVESRVLAIKIIGLDPGGIPFASLEKLLQTNQPSEIQLAVVNVLLRSQQDLSTNILLSKWNLFNPKAHDVVEAGFLARKERLQSLIKAIENDKIKPEWISRNTQNRLLQYSDTTIREIAKKIFKGVGEGSRDQVILDYNVSTTKNGDPAKGKTSI